MERLTHSISDESVSDGPSTTYPDGSILTLAGPCQSRFMENVAADGMLFSSRSFLHLPLVRGAEARVISRCFLSSAVGRRCE